MIVSYKHKFIFFRTRKTASSSIQAALSSVLGPDDVVTGTIKEGDKVNDKYGAGKNMDKFFTDHPHPSYADVSRHLNVRDFFSFGFVRNPFDIAVSRYHWDITGKGGQKSDMAGFKAWCENYCRTTANRDFQHPFLGTTENFLVDFVGRYETLQQDFDVIKKAINVEVPSLTNEKSGYRNKKVHYSEYYDEETIDLISKTFAVDLELFNYQFEFKQDFKAKKLNVVIEPNMLPLEERDNINGPSVIKVPDWVKNPLGKYYMYFAHHQGKTIKMAYSDYPDRDFRIHEGGVLKLEDTPCNTHIASPDVHWDKQGCIMLYHGDTDDGQKTFLADSKDGVSFQKLLPRPMGPFYMRSFVHDGVDYGIAKNKNVDSVIGTLKGCEFNEMFNLLPGSRHCATLVEDDNLHIAYSIVGEAPERIYICKIKLGDEWEVVSNYELLRPTECYEGADCEPAPSKYGRTWKRENQLRDPYFYKEGDDIYLYYSIAGENGIAVAKLEKE
jgi:hypothetical protein